MSTEVATGLRWKKVQNERMRGSKDSAPAMVRGSGPESEKERVSVTDKEIEWERGEAPLVKRAVREAAQRQRAGHLGRLAGHSVVVGAVVVH